MILFINNNNELDYKRELSDSVQDLLDAIDNYIEDNSLPCTVCTDNCCKRKWDIQIDEVFVKNNAKNRDWFIEKYLTVTKRNDFVFNKKGTCKFLNGNNRCEVHSTRPLCCRMYTCYNESKRLELLKGLVCSAYYFAFSYNYIYLKNKDEIDKDVIEDWKLNPAFLTGDYFVKIDPILKWAVKILKEDEYALYKEL